MNMPIILDNTATLDLPAVLPYQQNKPASARQPPAKP